MGAKQSIELNDGRVYLQNVENVEFSESVQKLRDNERNIAAFLPKSTVIRGIVLVVHGLHEHVLRHSVLAYALAQRGLAVYGLDHFAHGLSPGLKCLITDYQVLVDDFIEFARVQAEKHPGKPLFIYCHSLGTLITLSAHGKIHNVAGYIFSGIAIFSGPGGSSPFGFKCLFPLSQTTAVEYLAEFLSGIDPKGPAAPLDDTEITSDAEGQKIVSQDGRIYHGWIMNKTAVEALKLVNIAKKAIPVLSTPFLTVHGELDEIAYPKGSEHLIKYSATDASKKFLKIYPGAKHEPLHEKASIRDEVISDIVTFIEGVLTSSTA